MCTSTRKVLLDEARDVAGIYLKAYAYIGLWEELDFSDVVCFLLDTPCCIISAIKGYLLYLLHQKL